MGEIAVRPLPSPGLIRSRIGSSAWALLPAAAALFYLVALLPYAAGYGDERRTILSWLRMEWSQPAWHHAALAPAIAVFLAWRRRARLARLQTDPALSGLALGVLALGVYWAGCRANFHQLGYLSLQLLAAAALLWLWGRAHFKALRFAWLMLAFTWPAAFLEDTLAFRLRCITVDGAAWLLNAVGVATWADGTALVSAPIPGRAAGAGFSLAVDGPCSGLRSLFALMMVSALYAYFRQRSPARRLLLATLALPLAMLANLARIVILALASLAFGQEFAVGRGEAWASTFHILTGVAVFVAALMGLRAGEFLLNRRWGPEPPLPWIER